MRAALRSLGLAAGLALLVTAASLPSLAQAPTEAGLKAKGARLLDSADYEKLYVGNTLTGTASDGKAFHVFVESLSRYRMHYDGQRTADRWSVGKAGEFCATAGPETTCTREWLHDGLVHSFNPDGTLAGTARIRTGNPERL